MANHLCPDCYGEMNPILQRFNHKGHCRSYLPPPTDRNTWCTRCGASLHDSSGKIVHQVWCRRGERDVTIRKDLKDDGRFKTTFTEQKPMSVDGLIVRASKIAAEAHREMILKVTGDPYIHHSMRVAGRTMLLHGSTPVEIAAAWLHDTLKPYEDAAGPPMSTQDLEERGMPPLVIKAVLELTPPSWTLPKAQRMEMKRDERIKSDHLWFQKGGIWTQRIKLIDRIDNLLNLSWKEKDHMTSYCLESRDFVERLGEADPALKHEALEIINYYEKELHASMMAERDWH